MNIKLLDSIVRVIQILSPEEQLTLIERLNVLIKLPSPVDSTEAPQPENGSEGEAWNVFLSIGEDAQPGNLKPASPSMIAIFTRNLNHSGHEKTVCRYQCLGRNEG